MAFEKYAAAAKADGRWFGALKAIVRGEDWSTTIALEADLSAITFTGAVLLNPAAETPLATFGFVVGTYSDGLTELTPTLTEGDVDAMPADGDADFVEEVFFYILADGDLFAAGTIPVLDLGTA